MWFTSSYLKKNLRILFKPKKETERVPAFLGSGQPYFTMNVLLLKLIVNQNEFYKHFSDYTKFLYKM